MGEFLISAARELSAKLDGDHSAFSRPALHAALHNKQSLKLVSEAHQFLQTALMPDYEGNLFDYYRQQQYLLLLVFLSYPFRGPGCLGSYVEPYHLAADQLSGPLDILDYGAGIPFGAIDLIQNQPGRVRSITVVDLDLIHTQVSEHALVNLLGRDSVHFIRTRDADAIPSLSGPFNFCFGKDIFEHLTDPRAHLENIISATSGETVCYFDLNDHGERYLQHVTPTLSPLVAEVISHGFEPIAKVRGMSGFARN